MSDQHAERLCRELIAADSTANVVAALERAGYWNSPDVWRPLGDNPGNLSTVANQQSDPVAALAEKLTNSVDARLINACLVSDAEPEDSDGPASPRAAVARFVEKAGLRGREVRGRRVGLGRPGQGSDMQRRSPSLSPAALASPPRA